MRIQHEKINMLRKARGISQQKFADATGLSIGTVWRYEKKDVDIGLSKLQVIAEALGVSLVALIADGDSILASPGKITVRNDRIRTLRKMRGLTQQDLAGKIGLNQTSIARYEQAERDIGIYRLQAIADALDVTLSELVSVEAATYTEDEIEIIEGYRKLDEEGRRRSLALINDNILSYPKTMVIHAKTENNETEVSIRSGSLMKCLLADVDAFRPENTDPEPVIRARIKRKGAYAFPDPDNTDEYEMFSVTYDPKGSPYGTAIAHLKRWEEDCNMMDRFNITYIEIPD